MNNIKRHIDAETSTHRPDTAGVEALYRQLQDLQRSSQRGTLIRSREKNLLNNEKPTKYFFAQKQNRQEQKKITKLRDPTADAIETLSNDDYITETTGVLAEIHRHYTSLYKLHPPDPTRNDNYCKTCTTPFRKPRQRKLTAPSTPPN